HGKLVDVALGYATAADYATGNSAYFGLTIGRYASRIAGSTITIDGESYRLAGAIRRGGPPREVLHGGVDGFSNRVWEPSTVDTEDGAALRFTLVSPDGDQGFPGEMTVSVTYRWTDDYRLIVGYAAATTRPTAIPPTPPTYLTPARAAPGHIPH